MAGAKSAQELHVKEASARKIVTFCADLDEILGGGVTPGQITEFCKYTLDAARLHTLMFCSESSEVFALA